MSGDSISTLKMVNEQPLNIVDLDHAKRLLEPFEDIIIERFENTSNETSNVWSTKKLFGMSVVGLVLLLNFPKVKEKSGLNAYILWLISFFLLLGITGLIR
jgi:hypothetical protein